MKRGWCTSLMATADRNTCGLTFSMARGIEDYLTATDSQTEHGGWTSASGTVTCLLDCFS